MGAAVSYPCGASRGSGGLFGSRFGDARRLPARCSATICPGAWPAATTTRIAAADFYSKALAEDPGNEIILEQTFLLEAASAHWDRAIAARQGARQGRAGPPHRPLPARLRGLQARQVQGSRRGFRCGAPRADRRSHLDARPRLGARGRRQAQRGLRHARQLERCRLGPVLSALSPRAHRRHCRQARRRAARPSPRPSRRIRARSGSPTPTRAMR